MKKLFFLLLIPIVALIISSCSDDDPISPTATEGNLYLTSNPAGAQIWIDGLNTSKTTPDTVKDINQGVRNVTLRLQDYKDTTFAISITAGQTSIVGPITLVSDITTALYGPVKIYETAGTNASQPSGLDLSSGLAHGVSSPQANLVDIYYSTSGTGGEPYLVQSADLFGLVRVTKFFVGSGSNLFDGADSPDRNTGTWTNNMDDREPNYVFLYDHDGHYSKIKIVSWGGGVPGEPAWVEVQWYYNEAQLDKRFK
ncbi:MAG TPA: PEGA domain-containing protein [Ignavibacteriaceae bacterium]|nr:PEGA domain-containing protein [Ignavibacteriaceae bacterium]